MNTNREHPVKHFDWRLDVRNARFLRPGAKAWDILPASNGNGEILMPWHKPIGAGSLIEQDAADRETIRP
jgi:hypothetical protein